MILLSFWSHSPLSANKHHSTRGWYEVWLIDAVPLFLFHHHRAYVRHQIFVGGAFAQQSAQVVILLAEQAGAQLAIRGQADARTVSAERLRHRSNQPDLPRRAIRKSVLAGRFAALVRNLLQRPLRMNPTIDFGGWHDQAAIPVPIFSQRHVLNKSHDNAALARERRERLYLLVVDAAD